VTLARADDRLLPGAIVVTLLALLVRGILPPSQAPLLRALLLALVGLALLLAFLRRREPEPARTLRDPGVLVLVAALGVFLSIVFSHDMRITSDGVDHFVYLRSVYVDHDLELANDYEAVSPRRESVDPTTPLGRTGNLHPVGPALVWSPFYAVADLLCRVTGRAPDGHNALYRNAVAIASVVYGWLGLVLLYRTAAPRSGRGPALLAAIGIGFGTFLYWYIAYAPTMAHAPAFGAAALFVWLWLRPMPHGPWRAALLGAACGLAALMRWPNVLLALLPVVEALSRVRRRAEWPPLVSEGAAFALAALVVFGPQMIVWKLLYGSALTIPQGSSFLAGAPAIGGVLFSPRHGLFSWSPLLYLGVGGLLLLAAREAWRALAAFVLFVALTRVNAGVADWWGGSAFGARRFDAVLPLFGLGLALALAAIARWARRRPLAVSGAVLALLVLWNVLLAAGYHAGAWEYAESVSFEEMGKGAVSVVDRTIGSPFSLPASFFEWLRSGRAPADYESLFMERPHSRWTVRMGLDDRIFLEDGWTPVASLDGVSCRYVAAAGAGFVLPLHRSAPYRLGARIAAGPGAPAGLRVRVLVNQRAVGALSVVPGFSDQAVDVPADALRPGRNFVRLRIVSGESVERAVAVAGLWAEPAGTKEAP
jgi:hypothetical protein